MREFCDHVVDRIAKDNQFEVIHRAIHRLTSSHSSAAADSKTSPRNPIMCIVLHLENIASLSTLNH